jgi:hypothetical protein
LFFSLKKTRFFSFGKNDNNLEARKKKIDFFFSFALFFLAKKEKALPELGGLVLRPGVYSRALMYILYFFKVLFTRFCL